MVSFGDLLLVHFPPMSLYFRICVYLLHRVYSLFLYRLSGRRVYRVG